MNRIRYSLAEERDRMRAEAESARAALARLLAALNEQDACRDEGRWDFDPMDPGLDPDEPDPRPAGWADAINKADAEVRAAIAEAERVLEDRERNTVEEICARMEESRNGSGYESICAALAKTMEFYPIEEPKA